MAFVYAYRRTMASAKIKIEPDNENESARYVRLNETKAREQRAREKTREYQDAFDAIIRERRREANEAIRAGNERLRTFRATKYSPSISRILRLVSKATGVSIADIKGRSRSHEVSFARSCAIYWAARLTDKSTLSLGAAFDRDHTTIIHAKREYPIKRAKGAHIHRHRNGRRVFLPEDVTNKRNLRRLIND